MNELMNLFGQPTGPQSFDSIRISIASPEQMRSWSFGEVKNRRRLTIVRSNLKKTACSVRVSLVRLRITNVCAVNISA